MTTSHKGIKHPVTVNGATSKLAYVRWAPTSDATQTITDAQGITGVARTSAGLYVISFAGSPNIIIPMGSDYIENDSTIRHYVRVKSTSTTVGACTATVDHRVSTFATESSLHVVPCQRMADVSTASTVFGVAPAAGTITKIYSILGAAISGADSVVTCSIGATAITNGVITVANAASAAGDLDSATPTALNTVAAGDLVKAVSGGQSTDTATLDVFFVIQGTGNAPAASDTVDELCFTFLLVGGNL